MLVTYDGIVIGRREIGESSCFIDILTDEQGIVEAAAHGANKINSNLLSSTALFSYATFCLSKNKLRYTVNSAKPKYSFHEIGADIERLALASYFAQAVKFCTPSEQTQDSLVRFFAISLFEILHNDDTRRSLAAIKAAFELRYSCELGFTPNLVACDNCGHYDCENGMYFLTDSGNLICEDCIAEEEKKSAEMLFPDTLYSMRNIVFSPPEKCFKFRISENAEEQLSWIAENYFLEKVERRENGFPALRYYKGL